MQADNKVRKKKKRVSKHVLQAKERQQQQKEEVSTIISARTTGQQKPKKTKKKKKPIKNPSEAASYLSLWKNHREAWKFNKNNQSWFIRHMYDSDKIAKATFATLLEYLQGMPSSGKDRVIQDAKRRALRYKHFEKNKKGNDGGTTSAGTKGTPDAASASVVEEGEDDATRWKRLDDHEKRKEYKRARKVLESLGNAADTTEI